MNALGKVKFFLLFFLFLTHFCWASVEEDLRTSQGLLATFDQGLSQFERRRLKETSHFSKRGLTPRERRLYEKRQVLEDSIKDKKMALRLRNDLLNLPEQSPISQPSPARIYEAELIAKTAISAFRELRKKYGMIRPAILHNAFVNAGLKEGGFCWHWARDLGKRLKILNTKYFELHWATAREGTVREHNTLVITKPHGKIEDGLLLDGWRKSGRPYWVYVKKDHYPWKPGQYVGEDLELNH